MSSAPLDRRKKIFTSKILSELPESSRWRGPLLAEADGHFLKKLSRPFGEAVELVVELWECWRIMVLFSEDLPITC